MMSMSAAAYSKTPETCLSKVMPKDEKWEIITNDIVPCDKDKNTCAVFTAVSHKKEEIIISFRGTETYKQLLIEMEESMKPFEPFYNYGKVDPYFSTALNYTWPMVKKVLEDEKLKEYYVIFTGYSLGGSLASLASLTTYHLKLRPREKIALYTFGQPRTGNPTYSESHDKIIENSYRVVHHNDLIPQTPLCVANGNLYHGKCNTSHTNTPYHHGTEIWYNNGMKESDNYTECVVDSEDPTCSISLKKRSRYSALSHLFYFDKYVSYYGINHCEEKQKSSSSKVNISLSITIILIFTFNKNILQL
uniref:Lipase_3 domain-containing protein n=1 Tax=Parastrongyloides trichosuri TaxID=131310 RepID=A0A0N5A2Y6_PARTI